MPMRSLPVVLFVLVMTATATGSAAAGNEGPVSPAVLVPRNSEPEVFPLTAVAGNLVRRGPCVLLAHDGQLDLVIWRSGTGVVTSPHGTSMRFRNGSTVGPLGTYISLGGGRAPGAVLRQIPLEGFQRQCATESVVFASGPA